ncbi:MAG TPA: hypothetical protein VJ276_08590 [Thermoanaerobaculia bacterium]|nr:hypothetical protein [Thermoanaerobaculia bacterium]
MRRAGTIALLLMLATFVCLAADGDAEELGLATVTSAAYVAPPPPALDRCASAPADGIRVRDAHGVFHPPRRG